VRWPTGFFFGTFWFDLDIQRKKYTPEEQVIPAGGFFCCFALTPLPQRKAVDFGFACKISLNTHI